MIAQLRSIWFAVKASYWFYPALFASAGFFLALFLVHVDRSGAADWLNDVDWLHPSRPDGASNMLTVLAGSMIGVASTVFSITIAAVAYASGTYGPRLLTNFMEDKGNQLSLATFIGTFVYAITVLRTVRTEDETAGAAEVEKASELPGFVPQLSLLVGFGLMVLSVSVLVYFLHHIPASIRINTVLEGIGQRLLDMIEKRFPDRNVAPVRKHAQAAGGWVKANAPGYIRFIDLAELSSIAEENKSTIALLVRTGDFVQAGMPIARLDQEAAKDSIAEKIRSCFALGGSRTSEQDIEFPIDELVEIALRALSPGINDPFTAITAIHWLGAATSELGQRRLCVEPGADETDGCVIPLDDDFDHFVGRGFGAVRSALASNKLAALVALDTLRAAAAQLDDALRITLLAQEGDRLMAQAEECLCGPDLAEVRARHSNFQSVVTSTIQADIN